MADEGVPTKHMRKVRAFTKRIVTLESMVAAKERQAVTPNRPATATTQPLA
jgi:phage gp16-like protein